MNTSVEEGIVVALAWPETYAYSAGGKWYEYLYRVTGINDNKRYKAGHAGQILVRPKTGHIEYFDFGRYTTPPGHGRARGRIADPEVEIKMKATFDSNGKWTNYEAVFKHLESRGSDTHGEGPMLASICYGMDYQKCLDYCTRMVKKGSIIYDPFKKEASNCSRFVSDTMLIGALDKTIRLKLKTMVFGAITPTSNLYNGTHDNLLFDVYQGQMKPITYNRVVSGWKFIRNMFAVEAKHSEEEYKRIRGTAWWEPPRPASLPDNAQWVNGMGSGHWFSLHEFLGDAALIARYAHDGRQDCLGRYTLQQSGFNPGSDYTFIHDSHAYLATLEQGDQHYQFVFSEMLASLSIP
ncbi:MAG: DUF6695 family protein [Bacteroidota bacterium]